MITRIWHGVTKKSDKEKYLIYLSDTGIKDYLKTKGNLGVHLRIKDEEDITHFWIETKWDSYESIKSFAGDDINIARYYEEDKNFLIELEPNIEHFETLEYNTKNCLSAYINQLKELYDGNTWIEETLIKKLFDVTATESVKRPYKKIHSVQEIVCHIVNWRKLFVKRLNGDFESKILMNSPEDWMPAENVKAEEWGNIMFELESTQLDIMELLTKQDDSFLDSKIPNTDYDFRYLIEGIIHHDFYHLGQIGIVKKLIVENEK